jgi:hypothetical protein
MRFSRKDTCAYIADCTVQLANLAGEAGFNDLAFILEMASREANDQTIKRMKIKLKEAA